jgi:hypothetical protein
MARSTMSFKRESNFCEKCHKSLFRESLTVFTDDATGEPWCSRCYFEKASQGLTPYAAARLADLLFVGSYTAARLAEMNDECRARLMRPILSDE